MNMIKAEIITPAGVFYSESVHLVTMPGSRGEFGALAGHVASLVELQAGLVTTYDDHMKILDKIFVSSGFVEVTEEIASIMVEEAKYISDYNLAEVTANLVSLKSDLKACQDDSGKEKILKAMQITENLLEILREGR